MIINQAYKKYCLNQHYPIMQDSVLSFIFQQINHFHYHNLLEIGSCVGYSAIHLAQSEIKDIISLEKDLERHIEAKYFVKKYQLTETIRMIYDDALTYLPDDTFDVIIFDGAKGQNQAYLDYYLPYLNPNGMIIVDNIDFHRERFKKEHTSKNLKAMMRKLQQFIDDALKNPLLVTCYYEIGDGLLVIQKRNRD